MTRRSAVHGWLTVIVCLALPVWLAAQQPATKSWTRSAQAPKALSDADLATAKPGRDPNQALDDDYTKKIKEYTTAPYFLSPLVDYMPAAKGIPTPKAVLGDIAGAPGKL